MTSNATRATILVRALRAVIDADRATLEAVLTDDVRTWTPALSTMSRRALLDELERRDEAFTGIELDATPLDVGGDYGCVEWTVDMTVRRPLRREADTGAIRLAADPTTAPAEVRVTLHGVTVAEFQEERICSLRQYWDEFALVEQLGDLIRSR